MYLILSFVVNIVYYLLSIQTDRIRTYRVLFGMRCFSYMQNKHFAKSLAAILFTIQLETSSTSPNCFCNVSMPCQRVDKCIKVYCAFLKYVMSRMQLQFEISNSYSKFWKTNVIHF